MMSVSFHENLDYGETNITYDDVSTISGGGNHGSGSYKVKNFSPTTGEEIHLFAEKLQLPKLKKELSRPRLNELLAKFSEQIGATLIMGRAGTGKTVLAADFARNYDRVAWYRVEAGDGSWNVFSSYFAKNFDEAGFSRENPTEAEISAFVEKLFAQIETEKPMLIVLDDVHHIFDAAWFADFFNSLLHLLNAQTHVLLLARTSPAFPLWRLRSKQVLGVIDEELLLFNEDEAKNLLSAHKFPDKTRRKIYAESFGRIAKLKSLTESALKKRL